MSNKWFSISEDTNLLFNDLIKILSEVSNYSDHKIIIGTDSLKRNEDFVFITAVCIDCKKSKFHRKYFYLRQKIHNNKLYNLCNRLTKETSDSIDLGYKLIQKINNKLNIEIHSDINLNKKHESSIYSNMLKGYIVGCGFNCVLKPDSYVASSVADRHTRKI